MRGLLLSYAACIQPGNQGPYGQCTQLQIAAQKQALQQAECSIQHGSHDPAEAPRSVCDLRGQHKLMSADFEEQQEDKVKNLTSLRSF